MATPRSAATRISSCAHLVLVVALLSVLGGCATPLPEDVPEAVREYVALSHDEQYRALDQRPAAMRVELACAAWQYGRGNNTSLVQALAGSGCGVLPSIGAKLEGDRSSDRVARRLLDALAEMDLRSCDSSAVRDVIRAATTRIESITDSYDKIEARKKLDAILGAVSP